MLKKPECANCGGSYAIKVYWSTRNLLKVRMKTNYCKKCATKIYPKVEEVINDK